MITINIKDAATQMPRLLEQALQGENIVLCRNDVPVVEMRPVAAPPARRKPMLGNPPFPMTFAADAFDPLPEEIFNVFNDNPDREDNT